MVDKSPAFGGHFRARQNTSSETITQTGESVRPTSSLSALAEDAAPLARSEQDLPRGRMSPEKAAEGPSGLFTNSIQDLMGQDCGALKPPSSGPDTDPSHPANLMDSLRTGTR